MGTNVCRMYYTTYLVAVAVARQKKREETWKLVCDVVVAGKAALLLVLREL